MGKLFDFKMIIGIASAIALATVVVTPILAMVILQVRKVTNGGTPEGTGGGS